MRVSIDAEDRENTMEMVNRVVQGINCIVEEERDKED